MDFRDLPHNRARGAESEEVAVAWLVEREYQVRERNLRNHAGEIDLIADHRGVCCFVEIKARSSTLYGPAVEAVSPAKQRRIARAAALYLATELRDWRGPCRFDVLAMDLVDGEWRFTLVQDAFQLG